MNARRAVPPRIHVTIDRLVLDGLALGEQQAVVAALHADLHRLLSASRSAEEFGAAREIARVPADAKSETSPRTPAQIGATLAERIVSSVRT